MARLTSEPLHPEAITIRRATPEDVDALVDCYLSLAVHHASLAPSAYRVPDAAAVHERFSRIAEDMDPANLHLVAAVDGQVVGQLDAWGEEAPGPGSTRGPLRAVMVGLAVREGWRGRGIGTALIGEAERWARDRGLDEVRMEVAVENAAARRLYERLGYGPSTLQLTKGIHSG